MREQEQGASDKSDRATHEPSPDGLGHTVSVPRASWWHSLYGDYLMGSLGSREEALDAGIHEYGGEPFIICFGDRFKYKAPHFDVGRIAEEFDEANSEYGPEDEGPSVNWSDPASKELEAELTAVMEMWLDRHGYRAAWAIDARGHEKIEAQAIEARRAETGTGSVHESAVPTGCAQ